MTRRAIGLSVALALLALPLPAGAQVPAKVPRVGVLCPWLCPTPAGERPFVPLAEKHPDNLMADEAFRLGLRDLGYVEGQNILLEWRSALGHYERLPGLADELVQLEMMVNLATAKAIGAKVPPSVLMRVDRVIQ